MDGPLKELAKLEKLTAASSISDSLNSLLRSLRDAKANLNPNQVQAEIELRRKEIDERQKEIYSSLARLGKGLDKACLVHECSTLRTCLFRSEISCGPSVSSRCIHIFYVCHGPGAYYCASLFENWTIRHCERISPGPFAEYASVIITDTPM